MTEFLTAPQVARLLGVTAPTVKRWEAQGLLRGTQTPGGHHRFTRGDIDRLLRSQGGQSDEVAFQLIELMLRDDAPFALQAFMLELRGRLGTWWRVADKLGMGLTELGQQWKNGRCTIADEHIASRRFQQALWACIANLPSPPHLRKCMLAAAEGDDHTLGLSLAKLCLQEAGWNHIWLGSPTSNAVLIKAIGDYQPDLVAVSASAFSSDSRKLNRQYRSLGKICRNYSTAIVLGGEGAWPDKPPHGHRIRTFAEFAELLQTLERDRTTTRVQS